MENIIFSEGRGRPLSNMEGTSVQTLRGVRLLAPPHARGAGHTG